MIGKPDSGVGCTSTSFNPLSPVAPLDPLQVDIRVDMEYVAVWQEHEINTENMKIQLYFSSTC